MTVAFAISIFSFSALAAETDVCFEEQKLLPISTQVPAFLPPSAVDSKAAVKGKYALSPFRLAYAAKGLSVCIAVLVDETGAVRDAAAYYPPHVALTKKERNAMLSDSYSAAIKDGAPVKSISVVTVTLSYTK